MNYREFLETKIELATESGFTVDPAELNPALKPHQRDAVACESGLYSLIFGSKLENAKIFKRWVTSEVLPALRKTGIYSMNEKFFLDASVAGNVADLGRITEKIMKGQGSAPHKIAEVFALECAQLGIALPPDFVEVPDYEQVVLPCVVENRKSSA